MKRRMYGVFALVLMLAVLSMPFFSASAGVVETVVADPDGLDATDVARIKDIVMTETDYKPAQIKVMEAN